MKTHLTTIPTTKPTTEWLHSSPCSLCLNLSKKIKKKGRDHFRTRPQFFSYENIFFQNKIDEPNSTCQRYVVTMIPTATPLVSDEFPSDFIAGIDKQWTQLQELLITHPVHTDRILHNLSQYAEMYRHVPSAIAIAQPAEADLYNEFGFVEYEVAHPITVAKIAKKKRSRA